VTNTGRRAVELAVAEAQEEPVARALNLSGRERRFLTTPRKASRYSFPVHSGVEIDYAEAFLATFWPIPSRGGTRIHPTVTLDETVGLAMGMCPKHGLFADEEDWYLEGGGKLGVALDPKSMTRPEFVGAMRSLATALGDDIGPGVHVIAPDVGSDAGVMAIMMDERARSEGFQPDGFAGKPPLSGGRTVREPATGFGGAVAVREAAKRQGNPLRGARVAVCGYGAAGTAAAAYLIRLFGCVLEAASDVNGATRALDGRGLDVESLTDHVRTHGHPIGQFPGGAEIAREDIFGLDVDVLVLSAIGGLVDATTAEGIKASIVCEIGNAQMWPEAEAVLTDDDKVVIPDTLGGGLGSYASALELRGASPNGIWDRLEAKAVAVSDHVHGFAEERGLSLRTAAWSLGRQRVLDHARMCGRI
jgi:glutamate dehydrogenase/leucine dehydrogenase